MTTFSVPPCGGAAPMARPLRSTGGPPIGSHSASEWPCSDRAPGDAARSKRSTRVCCPASVSTLSASSPRQRDPQARGNAHQPAGAVGLARAVRRWVPLIGDTAAFVGERDARVVALPRRRHPPQPLFGDDGDPVAGEIDGRGRARRASVRGGACCADTPRSTIAAHTAAQTTSERRGATNEIPATWWRNLRPVSLSCQLIAAWNSSMPASTRPARYVARLRIGWTSAESGTTAVLPSIWPNCRTHTT